LLLPGEVLLLGLLDEDVGGAGGDVEGTDGDVEGADAFEENDEEDESDETVLQPSMLYWLMEELL
jgi:hypothetical protein